MSKGRSSELKYMLLSALAPVGGMLISAIALMFLILWLRYTRSHNILQAWQDTLRAFAVMGKTVTNLQDIGYIIARAEPFVLSGIAAAIAFRAGVFNIGTEGQYFIGGLTAAAYGIYIAPAVASFLGGWDSASMGLKVAAHIINLIGAVFFAMLGGALWALIPAVLKVKKGVHEVITTIMMNQIAYTVAKFFVSGPMSGLAAGESLEPRTAYIAPSAVFVKLKDIIPGFPFPRYIPLYESLFITLIVIVLSYFIIFKTTWGFELKMLGTNPNATKYSGVPPKVVIFWAMIWSGAIAGLINLQEIFGIRGFYTHHMTHGLGFDGIAVALIGYNNPLGVVLAALLFAFLRQAGYNLQFELGIPNSTMDLITGFIILVMVIASVVMGRYISTLRRKEVLGGEGR